jgi:hypothetical protein
MSVFQFTKSQRVIIPAAMAGAENVQGLVAEGHTELDAEPRYILQWPNTEKIEPDGLFGRLVGEVGQGELIKAQPPMMVPLAELKRVEAAAYHNGANDLRQELESERQLRIAKRKASRKASARKRTRK